VVYNALVVFSHREALSMPVEPGYLPANDQGLHIRCDYTCRVLRVALYAPLLPGYRPIFKHLAQYHSWGEWSHSPYFNDVTIEDAQSDILWFWHDMDIRAIPGEHV
jgi:hypothetical protein